MMALAEPGSYLIYPSLWEGDDEEEMERGPNTGGWAHLPSMLVEQILSWLTSTRYKARAGMTCRNWHKIYSASDRCWATFVYHDQMFTRRKFTLHAGWQYIIDHWKLRFLVSNATRRWRHLIIRPCTLIHNVCEFMRVLTNFTEYYEKNEDDRPLGDIRSFDFEWRMDFQYWGQKEKVVYGTGGQILETVMHLLSHMDGLRYLALRELLLDPKEAFSLMERLVSYFQDTLENLCILNLTKGGGTSCMHLGLFLNLRKLCVSPQHVDGNVVFLLASNPNFLDLYLIQDEKTSGVVPVSSEDWKQCAKLNPEMRVHLRIRGRTTAELVWQFGAPVDSIVYDNPAADLTPLNSLIIVENYADTLTCFVQRGIQRRYRSRRLDDRADSAALMLVRHCPNLMMLGIRERISTATALLLAYHSMDRKSDFYLGLRRNALLKKCDWPHDQAQWTQNFYNWLRDTSKDYDSTDSEISKMYGKPWHSLSDNEYRFKFVSPTG